MVITMAGADHSLADPGRDDFPCRRGITSTPMVFTLDGVMVLTLVVALV